MEAGSDLRTNKRAELEALFHMHGYTDFKWIDPKNIIVSQWVPDEMHVRLGGIRENRICPPNLPSVSGCERFFREYSDAVIFHFEKKVAKPEDRYAWTKKVNAKLSTLEREVFLAGYEKVSITIPLM